jgi:hypothetical protein
MSSLSFGVSKVEAAIGGRVRISLWNNTPLKALYVHQIKKNRVAAGTASPEPGGPKQSQAYWLKANQALKKVKRGEAWIGTGKRSSTMGHPLGVLERRTVAIAVPILCQSGNRRLVL